MMKKVICLVLAVMLALSAVSAFAAEYTDKDTVKKVQQALNDAGYDCGTPDGAAGKKTKAAITSYQTDKGLTVTSVIDDELLIALGLAEEEAAETAEEAPAEANEGYTFQGIPWGSSPEEVEAILVENGVIEEGQFNISYGDSSFFPVESDAETLFWTYLGKSYENIGATYHISKPLSTIGGQEIRGIDLYFLYELNDDVINPNLHFTMARIDFVGQENLFDKLSEKISGNYGDFKETKAWSWGNRIHTWYGNNATIISIMSDGTGYNANLLYTKSDDYLIAEQIQEINEANKTPLEDAGL